MFRRKLDFKSHLGDSPGTRKPYYESSSKVSLSFLYKIIHIYQVHVITSRYCTVRITAVLFVVDQLILSIREQERVLKISADADQGIGPGMTRVPYRHSKTGYYRSYIRIKRR
jgi:hypothetical protein